MSPFIIRPESSVHKNIKLLAITGLPIMLTYSAYFLCRLIKLLHDCEKQEFSPRQIKNDTFISLTFGAQEAQQPRDSFSGHRWYQGPCLHIFCEANTWYYYITHQWYQGPCLHIMNLINDIRGLVSIYSVTQNYSVFLDIDPVYITDLCMAFLWRTSDEPPSALSNRNLAASSEDMRPIFFCTASKHRMVARLVSMTTSSWK